MTLEEEEGEIPILWIVDYGGGLDFATEQCESSWTNSNLN